MRKRPDRKRAVCVHDSMCGAYAMYVLTLDQAPSKPLHLCEPHATHRERQEGFTGYSKRLMGPSELFPGVHVDSAADGVTLPARPERVAGLPDLEKPCGECSGTGRHGFDRCGSCDGHGVELTAAGAALLSVVARHFPAAP